MASVGQSRETLSIGDLVADVTVAEKLGGGGGIHAWSGTREDGSSAVVFALDGGLGPMARDQFLAAASEAAGAGDAPEGMLPVSGVDPVSGAYCSYREVTGTLADLALLNWDQKRKVKLFRRVCEVVGALHDKGIVHGWLRPENILLDNAFEPVVANARLVDIGTLCRTDAGMVWLHRVFSPPEVRHGGTSDMSADIFALGRVLHFVLTGDEPDEKDERVPKLDSLLKDHPNALIRIIRKCTTSDQGERYANAGELVEELDRVSRHVPVGMPHPDVDGKEESSMVDDARMRSVPPPKKSKPPSSAVTIELSESSDGPRFWSTGIAIGFGTLALLLAGVPLALAYFTGTVGFEIEAVLWSSAVCVGIATPGFKPNHTLARAFIALAVAGVLVLIGPVDRLAAARAAGLASGQVERRVAAMKDLMASGERNFRGVDLTGADLSGMDFGGLLLDGAVFRDANLSKANFSKADMANADLSGANIAGARFGDVVGGLITGLSLAKCDAGTTMPMGFECLEGTPLPAGKK